MPIDFAHYEGREQAYVKHTFLDKYLPALIGRIASAYREFVYIDGFAGPWQSRAGETFADTSFGIALRHMTNQKSFWASKGRQVRMRAFLVESDEQAFQQLQEFITNFPEVEVVPLQGRMEDRAQTIASSISGNAFSFALIDPKGFPRLRPMYQLMSRPNSETLINFMFDHANRFVGTDLIPALEDFFGAGEMSVIKQELQLLSGSPRREHIVRKVSENLRTMGDYLFAPVISVDNVLKDRPLYELILLTRHHKGLEVFRDCQNKALFAQATSRSIAKARQRAALSQIDDMFGGGEDAIPHDRSSKMIEEGRQLAKQELIERLKERGHQGCSWLQLWTSILTTQVATRSDLGRIVNDLRKVGFIEIPSWSSERKILPEDNWTLIWKEQ